MGKVKNETGAAWVDARTGLRVAKGGTLDVPDELVWGYVQSDNWSAADKATQAVADKQRAAIEAIESPQADDAAATEEEK